MLEYWLCNLGLVALKGLTTGCISPYTLTTEKTFGPMVGFPKPAALVSFVSGNANY